MKTIKLLNPVREKELENISDLLRKHGGLYVYYVREDSDFVLLKVIQKKNHSGNYLTQKEIINRVKETFSEFTPKKLRVAATIYESSPVEIATPEWIKKQMNIFKVPLKQMVKDLGVSKSDLSANINGHKKYQQRSKAMYYYYFNSLASKRSLGTIKK